MARGRAPRWPTAAHRRGGGAPRCSKRSSTTRETSSCSWPAPPTSAGSSRCSVVMAGPTTSTSVRCIGALSLQEQDLALAPSPAGRRRVVLATDIAETSLTVEGIRVVIDSGQVRSPHYDSRSGLTRLRTGVNSRGLGRSARGARRAGRAGGGLPALVQDGAGHSAPVCGPGDRLRRPHGLRARAGRVGHVGRRPHVPRSAAAPVARRCPASAPRPRRARRRRARHRRRTVHVRASRASAPGPHGHRRRRPRSRLHRLLARRPARGARRVARPPRRAAGQHRRPTPTRRRHRDGPSPPRSFGAASRPTGAPAS